MFIRENNYSIWFVFRDALLALLICPLVIIFILYWVETTRCALQISRYLIMRSNLFLELYVTVIDKNHIQAGPGQIYRKYLTISGILRASK